MTNINTAKSDSADVLIVGGGIIGCLTAYYLSQRELSTIVIEADGIASGASGTSAGWLTPYSHENDPAMLALSPATLRLHAELSETLPALTGIDHGYRPGPYLRCAVTEAGVAELREFQSQRASEGVPMEWLSGEEARSLSPWITAEIIGSLRSDNEPTLDSYRLTISALQAAEMGGARVISGKVIGLISSSEGVASGVWLEDGSEVYGGAVVIAMGPWSGEAAAWLDQSVPVTPQRGELVYLAPPGDSEGPQLEAGLNIVEHGSSILRKRLSDTIVAASRECVGFDRSTTSAARDKLLINAARLSSRVETAHISGQTACLRPISADGRAYVGRVPGWDDVFLATGHSGEGIHYGPVTGAAIAGLIVDGASEYDIEPLSPARAGATIV
ncbi:MAG: FAD-binding oxidoreductase [Dehalococcoidia bacterium]|jgi:glycine oxidase|nr:FAD-binding oxidoreductase [Dehalococcoidia bacterium]